MSALSLRPRRLSSAELRVQERTRTKPGQRSSEVNQPVLLSARRADATPPREVIAIACGCGWLRLITEPAEAHPVATGHKLWHRYCERVGR